MTSSYTSWEAANSRISTKKLTLQMISLWLSSSLSDFWKRMCLGMSFNSLNMWRLVWISMTKLLSRLWKEVSYSIIHLLLWIFESFRRAVKSILILILVKRLWRWCFIHMLLRSMNKSRSSLMIREQKHYKMTTMRESLSILYDSAEQTDRIRKNVQWKLIFVW